MAERIDWDPEEHGQQGTVWDDRSTAGPGMDGVRMSNLWRRVGAAAFDWALPWFIIFGLAPGLAIPVWLLMVGNIIVLQGITAASLGKTIFGLRLAWTPDRDSRYSECSFVVPGVARCAARYLLHVVDYALFGYIRFLWNDEHRSWADSLCKTTVVWDDRLRLQPLDVFKNRARRFVN